MWQVQARRSTLPLTLNEAGIGPASLQWTLEYAQADFSLVAVNLGPAATESGKTVTCTRTTGVTTCVLWSMDATPLGNGVIANVNLTASESTFANSSGIQLVNCLAASAAGNALPVSGQGGGVTLLQLITAIPIRSRWLRALRLGQTTIAWNAPDSSSVEVHVGSATGTLFAERWINGSAQTGDWVSNGMVFVLVDATTHAAAGGHRGNAGRTRYHDCRESQSDPGGAGLMHLARRRSAWNAPGSSSVEVHVGSAGNALCGWRIERIRDDGRLGQQRHGVCPGGRDNPCGAGDHHGNAGRTRSTNDCRESQSDPGGYGAAVGQTTITWNAPGSSSVEVHVGSATGTLFAAGGSTGSAATGDWVTNGMAFVLVDATTQAVLATTTVTQSQP